MTEQLVIMLVAATVGFASAVFLCIGNAFNTPGKIMWQSTPYWDFSEPVARALSAQRAQYIVGAFLLVVAFALQLAAALAPADTPVPLPQWLQPWPYLVLATLVPTLLLSGFVSSRIHGITMRKVLRMAAARQAENERIAKASSPS